MRSLRDYIQEALKINRSSKIVTGDLDVGQFNLESQERHNDEEFRYIFSFQGKYQFDDVLDQVLNMLHINNTHIICQHTKPEREIIETGINNEHYVIYNYMEVELDVYSIFHYDNTTELMTLVNISIEHKYDRISIMYLCNRYDTDDIKFFVINYKCI